MNDEVCIIGVDCATQPRKTGLARASWSGDRIRLEEARRAHPSEPAADILCAWMSTPNPVLLCLDAPLGWPAALGRELSGHCAGERIAEDADAMFHRHTDRVIQERLGKRPLEVGANFIARTALAAVQLLQEVRERSGLELALARHAGPITGPTAIEVYPAALRRLRGWHDRAAVDGGLACAFADPPPSLVDATDDVQDAVLCVLAGADFLGGRAVGPTATEWALAEREGWIWSADPDPLLSSESGAPRGAS